MEKKDLRIVYMGTPEFAIAPLNALITNGYKVVAVITIPDKPAGRGHKIQCSTIKQYALAHNLPLLQPDKLKDPCFLKELKSYHADLQVVVAFRMLPEEVWDMPQFGTFNLHAALLPQYRGAAPINWAIINGETKTGVTTFFLDKGMDTGKIIEQMELFIGEEDNMETIHDKLMSVGSQAVIDTVNKVIRGKGKVEAMDQSELPITAELRSAPKIFKDMCVINWNQPTKQIYDFIRGLSPYPAARTTLTNEKDEQVDIKVFNSKMITVTDEIIEKPGQCVSDHKNYLKFSSTNGWIFITDLQQAGKKRLPIKEFLKGFKIGDSENQKNKISEDFIRKI